MWTLFAWLPTEAPQAVGLSNDLPYGLLIGLLGAGLQIAIGEAWRLAASEAPLRAEAVLNARPGADAGRWHP